MPDPNDIVYEGYQIDFVYVGRVLFDLFGFDAPSYQSFVNFLATVWNIWTVVALVLSFFLLIAMIYAYIRNNQMGVLSSSYYLTQERLYKEIYGGGNVNSRWDDVQNHITTDNPNDWKLAIIEADVMLEEALESAGYAGLSVGDKLKSASPAQFRTLDDAWRAHKVRNQIAHGGADFVLTKKLAQETITQYRRVFQEFGVI